MTGKCLGARNSPDRVTGLQVEHGEHGVSATLEDLSAARD